MIYDSLIKRLEKSYDSKTDTYIVSHKLYEDYRKSFPIMDTHITMYRKWYQFWKPKSWLAHVYEDIYFRGRRVIENSTSTH